MILQPWHDKGKITQVDDMFDASRSVPVRIETDRTALDVLTNCYIRQTAELVERPTMDVPATVSGIVGETVSVAVPDPCVVVIAGTSTTVTGGAFEFTAAAVDTYIATVQAWPYKDATVTIEISAAPVADTTGGTDAV